MSRRGLRRREHLPPLYADAESGYPRWAGYSDESRSRDSDTNGHSRQAIPSRVRKRRRGQGLTRLVKTAGEGERPAMLRAHDISNGNVVARKRRHGSRMLYIFLTRRALSSKCFGSNCQR